MEDTEAASSGPARRPSPKKPGDKTKKSNRLWFIVNSGFGLWLLTTVVVGSASSLWTQRNECRADFRLAEQTFRKALVEYQYRNHGYLNAARGRGNPAVPQIDWRGPNSPFIFAEYRGRTLPDVTIDLLRSFGELSLVSDIASFDVNDMGLTISRTNSQTMSVGPPTEEAIQSIIKGTTNSQPTQPRENANSRQQPPQENANSQQNRQRITAQSSADYFLAFDEANRSTKGPRSSRPRSRVAPVTRETPSQPSPQEAAGLRRMERLLSSRDEDGVFAALRTTVMMRADPACGPTDIVARMFTDENRVYREQVMRLYRRVEEDYQRQILMLLALEQLLQSSPSRSAPSQ